MPLTLRFSVSLNMYCFYWLKLFFLYTGQIWMYLQIRSCIFIIKYLYSLWAWNVWPARTVACHSTHHPNDLCPESWHRTKCSDFGFSSVKSAVASVLVEEQCVAEMNIWDLLTDLFILSVLPGLYVWYHRRDSDSSISEIHLTRSTE